jgi:hypothetical protein
MPSQGGAQGGRVAEQPVAVDRKGAKSGVPHAKAGRQRHLDKLCAASSARAIVVWVSAPSGRRV